jgi:hypothetical protein
MVVSFHSLSRNYWSTPIEANVLLSVHKVFVVPLSPSSKLY